MSNPTTCPQNECAHWNTAKAKCGYNYRDWDDAPDDRGRCVLDPLVEMPECHYVSIKLNPAKFEKGQKVFIYAGISTLIDELKDAIKEVTITNVATRPYTPAIYQVDLYKDMWMDENNFYVTEYDAITANRDKYEERKRVLIRDGERISKMYENWKRKHGQP